MPEAPVEFRARYHGSEAPAGVEAVVRVRPDSLAIEAENLGVRTWPIGEIRHRASSWSTTHVQLAREGSNELLLFTDSAVLAALSAAAPARSAEFRPRSGGVVSGRLGLVLLGLLALVLVAAGFAAFRLAGQAASLVPVRWEETFGAGIVEGLVQDKRVLDDPRLVRPLEVVLARLADADTSPYTYRARIVDDPNVNALAAPGGHIVVYRGLLAFVETPEQLAAVLAHEIEHVRRRHVTRSLLQQASIALLIGALAGDLSGAGGSGVAMARELGNLSFSRGAELEADAGGAELMVKAGLDPAAMLVVLDRMGRLADQPGALELLSTHPTSKTRVERLRQRIDSLDPVVGRPLVDAMAWAALREAAGASPTSR